MNVQKSNGTSFGASVSMALIGNQKKGRQVARYLQSIGNSEVSHKVLANPKGMTVRTFFNIDGIKVPIADYQTGVNKPINRIIGGLRGAVVTPVLNCLKGLE